MTGISGAVVGDPVKENYPIAVWFIGTNFPPTQLGAVRRLHNKILPGCFRSLQHFVEAKHSFRCKRQTRWMQNAVAQRISHLCGEDRNRQQQADCNKTEGTLHRASVQMIRARRPSCSTMRKLVKDQRLFARTRWKRNDACRCPTERSPVLEMQVQRQERAEHTRDARCVRASARSGRTKLDRTE